MGGRATAEFLNQHGYTRRSGKSSNSNIAGMLSRPHCLGRLPGEKYDQHENLLPEDERSMVKCPQLISMEKLDRLAATRATRATRAPKNTAPRVIGGPTLLIGIAHCGMPNFGAGMAVATRSSGRYRYYKCDERRSRGASSCCCPNVRHDKLNPLVMKEVAKRIFDQDNLEELLCRVLDNSDEARKRKQTELRLCGHRLSEARKRLSNLHDEIEVATISASDVLL